MMNVLNVPSERFVQTDTIINFEDMAPCVPTERYDHHESFFLPITCPYGTKNQPFVYLNHQTLTDG